MRGTKAVFLLPFFFFVSAMALELVSHLLYLLDLLLPYDLQSRISSLLTDFITFIIGDVSEAIFVLWTLIVCVLIIFDIIFRTLIMFQRFSLSNIFIMLVIVSFSIFLSWLMAGCDLSGSTPPFLLSMYTIIVMVLVQTTIGRPFKTIIPIKFKQDDQQYLHIYEEQLERRGSLKVNIIQCMTIGPPTVGKTTLKEQLLANNGENTATVEGEHDQPPSSSVHEEVKRIQVILNDRKSKQSHCTVAVDKYNWKSLTFDEEVIGFLKNMSKSRGEYFTREEALIWAMCYICLGISLLSFANVIRIENAFKFSLSNLALTWTYSGLTVSMLMFGFLKCTKSSTTDIIAIAKEALLHNDIDEVQTLFDFTIYLRDSGGQPEFHEVLPALVSQSTLFLLVFNLSEGLDTQYEVTYKTSNGEVSDPYVSSFTVKQALLQSLASISSIGSYSKPQTNRLKSLFIWLWKKLTQLWKKNVKAIVSKVIIIGTHKDLLGDTVEADDVIRQMNNQLKDELKGTDWYSKDMVIPVEGCKLLLGVNTFSPKDIRKVKDLVNKVALNGDYQLEIPIPWLSFELCIRKLERKVMSLKECQHLANDCEIFAGGEFNAALWFLHNKVGTIRYFKNVPELRDIVITDSQLLFDLVTDLIVNTFSFGKNIEKMSEHDRFRSSGRFTKHHLEQCEAVKEKLLSVEQVIAVLEHLVIIAAVGRNESNEQEYFLPCVLVHASLPTSPLLHNDSDIPPLLIIFNCHYTPRGIFSLLIAKILLDGKNKWELCSEEIKRNQVDFCLVKSGHIVTITNLFAFLEIAVKSPCHATERSLENVYVVIKHYISRCLNDVRKQLNYTAIADHSFGFYCKKFHNQSADHHPAICNDSIKPTYTKCHLKCKFTSYLLPQHHLWFYNNRFSSQQITKILKAPKPSKHELLKFLSSTTARWEEIGDLLGVDSDTIEGLRFSNHSNYIKMSEMLQSWLDNDPTPVTWDNIISILDGPLQKKSVADEIRKFLYWT